jgi:DNA-binding transcriptional LysR family regulator
MADRTSSLTSKPVMLFAHGWVMRRVAALQRASHELRILVDTAAYAAMMEALAQRRTDIGIAMAPQPAEEIASVVVDEVEFCLVVPRGHRLATAPLARAADLDSEQVVTLRPDSPVFGLLRETPFGPVLDRGSLEVGSSLLACAAVAHGAGVAIAERSLAADPPSRSGAPACRSSRRSACRCACSCTQGRRDRRRCGGCSRRSARMWRLMRPVRGCVWTR